MVKVKVTLQEQNRGATRSSLPVSRVFRETLSSGELKTKTFFTMNY